MRSVLAAAMGRHNEIVRTIDAVPQEADTAHLRWDAPSRVMEDAMANDEYEVVRATAADIDGILDLQGATSPNGAAHCRRDSRGNGWKRRSPTCR